MRIGVQWRIPLVVLCLLLCAAASVCGDDAPPLTEEAAKLVTLDVILGGLAYPDVPSAEGYMPNWNEAWARLQTFGDLMYNTAGLDLATEIATLEADMGVIFNK